MSGFFFFGDEFAPNFLECADALSNSAFALYTLCGLKSKRRGTDGLLTPADVDYGCRNRKIRDRAKVIAELVDCGLWEALDVSGYQSDWTHQSTAEQDARAKEKTNARQADMRERNSLCKSGDHSMCVRTNRICQQGRSKAADNETSTAATTPVAKASALVVLPKVKPAQVARTVKALAHERTPYIDYETQLFDDDGNPSCTPEMARAYCDQEIRLTKAAVAGITAKATKVGLEFRCGADIYAISQRGYGDRNEFERSYRSAANQVVYTLREAINDPSEAKGMKLAEDEVMGDGRPDWPVVFECAWGELNRENREDLQEVIDRLAPQFEHLALVEMTEVLLDPRMERELAAPYILDAVPPAVKQAVMDAARKPEAAARK